jgi:hypothetical protein
MTPGETSGLLNQTTRRCSGLVSDVDDGGRCRAGHRAVAALPDDLAESEDGEQSNDADDLLHGGSFGAL